MNPCNKLIAISSLKSPSFISAVKSPYLTHCLKSSYAIPNLKCSYAIPNLKSSRANLRFPIATSTLNSSNCRRFYSTENRPSALFISGDKASKTYAVLTPYIDFEIINNRDELARNLKSRGIGTQVLNIEQLYDMYKAVATEKSMIEYTRAEIASQINKQMNDTNEDEVEGLKTSAHISKSEYKAIREYFYVIEEMMALKMLGLPNVLHKNTPVIEDEIIYQFDGNKIGPLSLNNLEEKEYSNEKVQELSSEQVLEHLLNKKVTNQNLKVSISNHHLKTGADLIEYLNPSCVYLKNDAALFELAVLNYFQTILVNNSFIQFSNCDFVSSVVVEGCGRNFKSKFEAFTLEQDEESLVREHLEGGSSISSFMAYFTKHSVQPSYFPLRLFTNGRTYLPVEHDTKSLFNVSQTSAVTVFVATKDDEASIEQEFNSLVEIIKSLYNKIGIPYRLSYLRSNQLDKSESLRLSIQVYSSNSEKFIEVGNLSMFDTYLSKRLLFNYTENKERYFPKVLGGSIIKVHALLGCVLEDQNVNLQGVLKELNEYL